ncbi:MAG: 4-(cytidine 5'-diphospho)-2-C-methyl-D-erythritol kinase [Pseudomonadota bacterium]
MASVKAFAPAKINLALHVGPPRAVGRHGLASIVAFCDAGDWIEVEEGPPGLTVTGPFATALAGEADNLVMRAIALIAPGRPVRVRLEKNLPVASGVGGGSADAAAALRAVRLLLDLPLSDGALARMAGMLGSDVPACVHSRAAVMRGTGEDISPIVLPDLFAVLVNPGVPLSTAAVYRCFDERAAWGGLDIQTPPSDTQAVIAALGLMRNDLEAASTDLAPEVGAALAALRGLDGVRLGRMSGSGATCFGLTDNLDAARRFADRLRQHHPDWWICATRLGEIDVMPMRV